MVTSFMPHIKLELGAVGRFWELQNFSQGLCLLRAGPRGGPKSHSGHGGSLKVVSHLGWGEVGAHRILNVQLCQ